MYFWDLQRRLGLQPTAAQVLLLWIYVGLVFRIVPGFEVSELM